MLIAAAVTFFSAAQTLSSPILVPAFVARVRSLGARPGSALHKKNVICGRQMAIPYIGLLELDGDIQVQNAHIDQSEHSICA